MPLQAAATMVALLDEEIREAAAFVALMREEQALLTKAGSGEVLMPLIERKTAFITSLKALADRREALLREAGYAEGRVGMEAWLTACASGDASLSLWPKLLALAAQAKQINEINGKLIDIHWQHNQGALTALMSAADRAATYGPDGQAKSSAGGRFFGRA